ncbi:MAG: acyl-CoA dehydrogenase family protein [Dehalococcoidia bacterium]|nr:acyl-CoA dehydrogenase family protein [Dehalococcoidia bacterium]
MNEMDFFFTPEHKELRQKVHRLAQDEIEPSVTEEGDIDTLARESVALLAREGLTAIMVPAPYGGRYDPMQAIPICIVREELTRVSSLADSMFAMQGLGSYPITLAGSPEVKARFLPPVGRGGSIAAFALTEVQAGSDVAGMETHAERRGNDYVVNGSKRFISNAGVAGVYTVFAKTDPQKGAKGISAFAMDGRNPGFHIVEKMRMSAPHPIAEVAFRDCRIPSDQLLGAEGEGFKIAMQTLDLFRVTVGAAALGFAQRALEEGLKFSKGRHAFGHNLSDFQLIRAKIANMATELMAARLLVYQAAWLLDRGTGRTSLESSMAKYFATEMAQRAVDQSQQIHGGLGVTVGSVVERLYREVRGLRLYEGTSEIQQIVIAGQLIKDEA